MVRAYDGIRRVQSDKFTQAVKLLREKLSNLVLSVIGDFNAAHSVHLFEKR